MSKENGLVETAKALFEDYFREYYSINKNVQSVNFYDMKQGKGCFAVVEYRGFLQYIAFYDRLPLTVDTAVINTCFEFDNLSRKIVCHLDTILDFLDSDDISFYTYSNCTTDELIFSKLDLIMSATEKYFDKLIEISCDSEKLDDLCLNYCSSEDFENAFDDDYVLYREKCENLNEFYLSLKAMQSVGELSNAFEKRAYRVLNNMSVAQRRRLQRAEKKQTEYSAANKFYLYAPTVLVVLFFVVGSIVLGFYLDKYVVNVGWIGKGYGYTGVACGLIGVSLSLIALMLNFDRPLCKLITPKSHYEDILQMIKAEEAPKVFSIICIVFAIVVSIVISVFFLFTGIGLTEDYKIVERKYAFSPVCEYSLEDTEIAIIKGTIDDWEYLEYTDTAYAFKLNGEWVEFGVAPKEAQTIIETAIEKYDKDVNVYNTVESIPLNE